MIQKLRRARLSSPSARLLAICLRLIGVVTLCVLFYIQEGNEPFLYRRAGEMLQVIGLSLTLAICGTLVFDMDYKKKEKEEKGE